MRERGLPGITGRVVVIRTPLAGRRGENALRAVSALAFETS
jgi:hypothetical protein